MNIDSMLKGFVRKAPGALRAFVASTDGRPLGGLSTMDLPERDIKELPGRIAALLATADGCGEIAALLPTADGCDSFGGGSTRTIMVGLADVNLDDAGVLVVMRVGTTAGLAVQAKNNADIGLLVAEMKLFVSRLERTWPLPTRLTGTLPVDEEAPPPVSGPLPHRKSTLARTA